jgi:ATP-dependent DNA ligase
MYVNPKRGITTSGRAPSLDEAKLNSYRTGRGAAPTRLPRPSALLESAVSLRPRTLPAGFIAPCLPTSAAQPPSGDSWLHEIKHDGFRVIARKDDQRVKLYSRPGNDLTYRFPLIVEALAKLRSRSCIIC